MTGGAFLFSGGFWIIVGGYSVLGLLLWLCLRNAPYNFEIWGDIEPDDRWGKPIAQRRQVQRVVKDTGDEAAAVVFAWPRYDHLLDAEFQRGPFTPKDAA